MVIIEGGKWRRRLKWHPLAVETSAIANNYNKKRERERMPEFDIPRPELKRIR